VPIIHSDTFDADQCLAFFGRLRRGRVALTMKALPVVFPVPYLVDGCGFLVGVSTDQMAEAMDRSVIALQADGWAEDVGNRWTTLAIGRTSRVEVQEEHPTGSVDVTSGSPWDEPHIFRLQPEVLSGRWLGSR
jgi:uncharacterized protein